MKRKKKRSAPRRVVPAGSGFAKVPTLSDVEVAINDAQPFRHCDEYIDDVTSPEALRKYLDFARAPAHGALLPKPHPQLYADYDRTRVRVTMASRLGDVGIVHRLPTPA